MFTSTPAKLIAFFFVLLLNLAPAFALPAQGAAPNAKALAVPTTPTASPLDFASLADSTSTSSSKEPSSDLLNSVSGGGSPFAFLGELGLGGSHGSGGGLSELGLLKRFFVPRANKERWEKMALSDAVLDRAAGEPLIKRAERFQLRMKRAAEVAATTA
ncbi:hypothetical protein BDN70DRAFT_931390 [Pholiota conissans]|uniref:Uncharacterized protein n=1 Tax=Pholiota conissans TaxID=109636 RepID=A0A9P6D293_9AGAR|nr:hypothetical protein BDN70DRAFT_931390 [Pholiota conissans]